MVSTNVVSTNVVSTKAISTNACFLTGKFALVEEIEDLDSQGGAALFSRHNVIFKFFKIGS